jgi:hypothetical protein
MFGDELHWVEVLPLAVMERNMKAQQSFSYKISPFEVHFFVLYSKVMELEKLFLFSYANMKFLTVNMVWY